MEEVHRERYGGQARASMPSHVPVSQHLHVFTYLGSPNPAFSGFMEGSLHRHMRLSHWPLVSELNLKPLSSPQQLGDGLDIAKDTFITLTT